MDFRPAIPHDLRYRIRDLLQPWLIGATTVKKKEMGIGPQHHRTGGWRARSGCCFQRTCVKFYVARFGLSEYATLPSCLCPENGLRIAAAEFAMKILPRGINRVGGVLISKRLA